MPFGNPYLTNTINGFVKQRYAQAAAAQEAKERMDLMKQQVDLQFETQKKLAELAAEQEYKKTQRQMGLTILENQNNAKSFGELAAQSADPREKAEYSKWATIYGNAGSSAVDKDTVAAFKTTQQSPAVIINQGKVDQEKVKQQTIDQALANIGTKYKKADWSNPDTITEILTTETQGLDAAGAKRVEHLVGAQHAAAKINKVTEKTKGEKLPPGLANAQKEYQMDMAKYLQFQANPKKFDQWKKSPEFLDFAARINFNSDLLNQYEQSKGRESVYPTFDQEEIPDVSMWDKIQTLVAGKQAKWKLSSPTKEPAKSQALPPLKEAVSKLRQQHPDWTAEQLTAELAKQGYK